MQTFKTTSDFPMIPMARAWAIIEAQLAPLPPLPCALDDLLGLVLAEDLAATEDAPPFAASTMDGYAVIAGDSATERLILGEQDAGEMTATKLIPGTAMRIMTGAPLPAGADAVIKVEDTDERDGQLLLSEAVIARATLGANVRAIGSDIAQGQLVVRRNIVVGPAEIGLLATIGCVQAMAYPVPRVAVLATGDELVSPEQTPGPGQIRDSNSYALSAAARQAGATPRLISRVVDTYEALRQAMIEARDSADIVLTSGGVSMGTKDLVKPVLAELGTTHFGRVAIKPGKPLTYATLPRPNGTVCHMIGLPGNPVSSLVTFENVVRPMIRILAGHQKLWRPERQVRLAHALRHDDDRTEYQRAALTLREGQWWASSTGSQASSRLMSLTGANALLRIPQGVGDLAQGELVDAILVDQPEVEASS